MSAVSSEGVVYIGLVLTSFIAAQYALLFVAAATVHSTSYACERKRADPTITSPTEPYTKLHKTKGFGSYNGGWLNGVCLTQEQVWCRANDNRHPDCELADCRAEEIRIVANTKKKSYYPTTVIKDRTETGGPLTTIQYSGCRHRAGEIFETQRQMFEKYESLRMWNYLLSPGDAGPCVPIGDPLDKFLEPCHAAVAQCRGTFFNTRLATRRTPMINCTLYWDNFYLARTNSWPALWNVTGDDVSLPGLLR